MRVIIAGSRGITDSVMVKTCIDLAIASLTDKPITTVLSGTASGVDSIGEEWAKENNIPIERYPAQWGKFGRSAGYKRNEEMAGLADGLILIWDGESKGSGHMLAIAEKKGLKIQTVKVVKNSGVG